MQDFGFSSAGGGTGSTLTAIVDISSAEILTLGGVPVELLPDPGLKQYYNILNIVLEYNPGAVGYAMPGQKPIRLQGCYEQAISYKLITGLKPQYSLVNTSLSAITNEFTYYSLTIPFSKSLQLFTADTPLLGDGTLRAIISYEIRTFGA